MSDCASCGTAILEGQEVLISGKTRKDPNISLCDGCASSMDQVFQEETEGANVLMAIVWGLIAAVVSSVLWYGIVVLTNYQIGLVAVVIGWLVGKGVTRGAGGKRGALLQGISVTLTLLAMIISEYLIMRHVFAQFLSQDGAVTLPLLLPFDMAAQLIYEGLNTDMLTLLFWVIALFEAFKIPARRQLRRVKRLPVASQETV